MRTSFSITNGVLSAIANPHSCVDCGGDCDTILESMRVSFGYRRCNLCSAPEPEVKLHSYAGEVLCNMCAQELMS